jgi:hypothetical protein
MALHAQTCRIIGIPAHAPADTSARFRASARLRTSARKVLAFYLMPAAKSKSGGRPAWDSLFACHRRQLAAESRLLDALTQLETAIG